MSTHVSTTLSLVTFLILERFLFFHGVTDLGNPAQQDDFIIIIMVLTHYSGDTLRPVFPPWEVRLLFGVEPQPG